MLNASRNWPHAQQPDTRYYDKQTGKFYTKGDDGEYVEVRNAAAQAYADTGSMSAANVDYSQYNGDYA